MNTLEQRRDPEPANIPGGGKGGRATSGEISARREVYHGKVVSLELQTLRLSDGRSPTSEVVLHRPCVAMVPVDADGRIILVRQFRAPAASELLEIPAGGIDEGEAIEAAVQRELQEETGFRAGSIRRLGAFYTAPGYCTEFIHIFRCESLSESRLAADEDEQIEVVRWTLEEALAGIASGEIRDAKSVAGLLLYARGQ
ncbi:MAG: NUDIX hydrolase [Dehalococcoidia bacterium]